MATRLVTANTLDVASLKQELDSIFSNYSFDVSIRNSKSYFGLESSWDVTIKPSLEDIEFEIHVEESDGCFVFEFFEDVWESLDAEMVFKFLFFELLNQQGKGC